MSKIKEVLRLYHEVHLGQREIARCAQLAQSTVHEYLERARAAGLGWPLPEGQDEEAIENLLFPRTAPAEQQYPSARAEAQNGFNPHPASLPGEAPADT